MKKLHLLFFMILFLKTGGFGAVTQIQRYQIPDPCIFPSSTANFTVKVVIRTASGTITETSFTNGVSIFEAPNQSMTYLSLDLRRYAAVQSGDPIFVELVTNCPGKDPVIYRGNYLAGVYSPIGSNNFHFTGEYGLKPSASIQIPDVVVCEDNAGIITADLSGVCGYSVDWGTNGISTINQTSAYVQGRVDSLPAGVHHLTARLIDGCGNVADSVHYSVTVTAKPVVSIFQKCLSVRTGTIFSLSPSIYNMNLYNYSWSLEQKVGNDWVNIPVSEDQASFFYIMGVNDLRCILKSQNKNTLCWATDTAMVYHIPDAPVVAIDTIQDKRHIKLKWSPSTDADSYTVYSVKWDPYTLNGGVYLPEVTATQYKHTEWIEPVMDSLEFYYVVSERQVCGSSYFSLPSDTVGYVRHIADATQPLENGTSYKYAFPYIFNMGHCNINILTDLADYITDHKQAKPVSAISLWVRDTVVNGNPVFSPGMWNWLPQAYAPSTGWSVADQGIIHGIKVGDCIMMDIEAGKKVEFVLFGKLKDAEHVRFINRKIAGTTSNNALYIPFREIQRYNSPLLGQSLVNGNPLTSYISAINYWKFSEGRMIMDNYAGFFNSFMSQVDSALAAKAKARAGYDVIFFDVGGAMGNQITSFQWPQY